VYVVRLESVELETSSEGSGLHELIETGPIIPSVDDSGDGEGRLSLNPFPGELIFELSMNNDQQTTKISSAANMLPSP